MLKPIIAYDSYWVLERSSSSLEEKQVDIPVEFRLATLQDLDQLVSTEGHPLSHEDKEKANRRFLRGDLCFISLLAGRIISYSWVAFKEAEFTGKVHLKLGPGWAYLYRDYTISSHRGKGIHRLSIARRVKYLKSSGIEKTVSIVHKRNFVASRNYFRSGYSAIGCFREIELLGRWQIAWIPSSLKSYLVMPAESLSTIAEIGYPNI